MKKKNLTKLNFSRDDVPGYSRAKFDLQDFPWPIKDDSIEEVMCHMKLQYLDGIARARVMDEFYRILQKGGKVTISVPYWSSVRSIQDYATAWPPLCEASFQYFNKAWRDLNHPDRKLKCDFDFGFSYQVPPDIAGRADDVRTDMIAHYNNTVLDMIVVLTKK